MSERARNLARGAVDDIEIHVGDTVLVRGVVQRSLAGVGALVRFTSKTEDYDGWIREADLRHVVVDGKLAEEPADGTWLLVDERADGRSLIFHRNDAEGHYFDENRRYQQHWYDVVNQCWIDWPTAVALGAAGGHVKRMRVEGVHDDQG